MPIPTNQLPNGSSGLFTYGMSYGIQDATDGTSNTIAYAEWLTGNQGQNYDGATVGSKYRGNFLIIPTTAGRRLATCSTPRTTRMPSSSPSRRAARPSRPPARRASTTSRAGAGRMAPPPSACSTRSSPRTTPSAAAASMPAGWLAGRCLRRRAASAHPGGLNCAFGRRQRQVHQEHHQPPDVVVPRDTRRRRGPQRRRLLIPNASSRAEPGSDRARPRARGRDACRSSCASDHSDLRPILADPTFGTPSGTAAAGRLNVTGSSPRGPGSSTSCSEQACGRTG